MRSLSTFCAPLVITIALVVAVSLLSVGADAVFFRMATTSPTCFEEDVGYKSLVVVVETDRRHDKHGAGDSIPVTMEVTSPLTKTIVSSEKISVGLNTHIFKPLATEVGVYVICFHDTKRALPGDGSVVVDVGIKIDHHDRSLIIPAPDPELVRKRVHGTDEVFTFTDEFGHKMETLKSKEFIERVNEQTVEVNVLLQELVAEVSHFKARSERFRQTVEATFDRVWVVALITILAIFGVSYFQFQLLSRFLRRKRMV